MPREREDARNYRIQPGFGSAVVLPLDNVLAMTSPTCIIALPSPAKNARHTEATRHSPAGLFQARALSRCDVGGQLQGIKLCIDNLGLNR